jgi:hypothetical protein
MAELAQTLRPDGESAHQGMTGIPFEQTRHFASETFKSHVAGLIEARSRPDVIEVGAGRSPLFSENDLPANAASNTISDISRAELDRAPCRISLTGMAGPFSARTRT